MFFRFVLSFILISNCSVFTQEQNKLEQDTSSSAIEIKEIDSAKKVDIFLLIKAFGDDKQVEIYLDQMMSQYQGMLQNVPEEYWKKLRENFKTSELLEQYALVYDTFFTHDDIKELIKFFESPIGQKYVKLMPLLINEIYNAEENWGYDIRSKSLDILKKDGYINMGEQNEESKEEQNPK